MNTFLKNQGVTEEGQRCVREMAGIMAIEAFADTHYHSSFPAFTKIRTLGTPKVRLTVKVERL